MASEIPKTMKALVTQADKTAKIEEIPVPEIDDTEVLVKVVALAQNPTDWKHIKGITNPGTICGCDWSGYVVKTGRKVSSPAVGDHVAGFVHGGTYKDRGAFAEYVKATGDLCWKVPEGMISHEEAATMGCSFWTAVQALFHPDRLGLVEPPNKVDKEEWVLVYGGSGSVGMFAIQLAHIAGYKVVATASPRNHELCKSLGADAVIDYKDPSAIEKIKEVSHNSIRAGLDAISEAETQKFCVQAFGAQGGKLVTILGAPQEVQRMRADVKVQSTLIYTSLGRSFIFAGNTPFPASEEDRGHMAQFLKKVPELVKSGQIKPNPTMFFDGGLEGINAGLQHMMEGKHSGQKIVYRLTN
ncbi:zinc-binding alcohol dehydrogenase family protein [Phanerochaete sordida]|uniref:Zinc-binding alcohol dehydrogenase family protein n=1 Tax=Phanerochaete sordida TaxID=48140 RepID=A0A9P3L9Q9_9APHY|nr:zinc-binding alcohol dehydrogenase family protein [Phanerochaete sordida]